MQPKCEFHHKLVPNTQPETWHDVIFYPFKQKDSQYPLTIL